MNPEILVGPQNSRAVNGAKKIFQRVRNLNCRSGELASPTLAPLDPQILTRRTSPGLFSRERTVPRLTRRRRCLIAGSSRSRARPSNSEQDQACFFVQVKSIRLRPIRLRPVRLKLIRLWPILLDQPQLSLTFNSTYARHSPSRKMQKNAVLVVEEGVRPLLKRRQEILWNTTKKPITWQIWVLEGLKKSRWERYPREMENDRRDGGTAVPSLMAKSGCEIVINKR